MIRFVRTDGKPGGYTTVGWWGWSLPNNKGTLTIEVSKLGDWRFEAAVLGHELLEALYCKLAGVTTEVCDAWDDWVERQYENGSISKEVEGGDIRACPYYWGHQAGVLWEYVCIYGTFASFEKYEAECNRVMDIL